jgi:hypothetical protein
LVWFLVSTAIVSPSANARGAMVVVATSARSLSG